MTARKELLPCPFCGEKRISLNEPGKGYRYGSINCPACLVVMPGEVRDRDELIRCWNGRELPDSAQNVPSSEALSHIDERLADLREANGIFEKSTRDQSRDILRNSREIRWLVDLRTMLISPTPVSSTSRCGASDAPEEVTGAEMDAIEAAAIAGNPLTTNDYELAGWARQWHWNDCAGDQPVDPSIYFRDMRMLKAFIQKCQSVTSKDPRHE